MTEFDPYEVLGIGRSAEHGAIKAAYRLKVRGAHPDRGGNPADFITIVKAFGLLSDPELRQVYDQTGIVDLDGLRAYRRDVATVLADMFDAAVQSAVAAGLKLSSVNFIELMTSAVNKGQAEAQRQSKQIDGEIDALTALSKRIRRNDTQHNIFVERLASQIKAKTEQHSTVTRRLLILETASIELGNYESDVELI